MRDIILCAGETFELDRPGLTLLSALPLALAGPEARLRILTPHVRKARLTVGDVRRPMRLRTLQALLSLIAARGPASHHNCAPTHEMDFPAQPTKMIG
jgi:hypothetical protein